jgi:hypothetical protein
MATEGRNLKIPRSARDVDFSLLPLLEVTKFRSRIDMINYW